MSLGFGAISEFALSDSPSVGTTTLTQAAIEAISMAIWSGALILEVPSAYSYGIHSLSIHDLAAISYATRSRILP